MKYIIALFIFISFNSYSQRLKIEEGNPKELKSQNNYNLVFDYSNLEIVNYKSEIAFLKEKVALREAKSKGLGKKFRLNWFGYRKKLYEPSFVMNFNNYFIMKKKIFISRENKKAKYTVLIKSLKLYPGYNVKMAWEPAKLWAEVIIYETKNPKNIVLHFKPIKIYQGYYDMDLGQRVANAYGVLGKTLAKFLKKKS